MQGDNISTVGDNIRTVEGIQYSGGRILTSTCLVINNDDLFVLRYEIFIRKFFENSSRFHVSCILRAGLVYSRSNLVSK